MTHTPTSPKAASASEKAFSKFWFISGGSVYGAFKQRRWSVLRDLANQLPKMAWDRAYSEGFRDGVEAAAKVAKGIRLERSEAHFWTSELIENEIRALLKPKEGKKK